MHGFRRTLSLALVVGLAACFNLAQQGHAQDIPLARGAETTLPEPAPGFVGVKEGHLVRDGQRLRIWGIDTVNEITRPKKDQLRILDRIKAMGFNGIRIHLADWRFVPPKGVGYEVSGYTKGDDSAMDLFDHYIAAAAERGLVVYMTLDRKEVRISPDVYDLLPKDGDEAAWKQSLHDLQDRPSQPSTYIEQVWPTDARLERMTHKYALNLLNHVNQYTGHRMADEPAIGLWEIANESNYIDTIVDGSSFALKGQFAVETQKLWNDFLKKNVGTTEKLRKRWGGLESGESLEKGTIKLSPLPIPKTDKPYYYEDAKYPSRRIRDLITFFINNYIEKNNELVAAMRAAASKPNEGIAVAPIGFDTHYTPSLLNMYCAGAGDLMIAGTYKWYRTYDESDPTYPFTSALAHTGWYGMDLARIEGKPTITYEINVHKPAPYRAEFPYLVSAYMQSQDWDGVFWYFWMSSDAKPVWTDKDLENDYLRYSNLGDNWAGVNTQSDHIMLAALHQAGIMFRNGLIRPSPKPAIVQLSEEDLIWSFNSMEAWMKFIGNMNYRRGTRINVLPPGTRPQGVPNGTISQANVVTLGPDVKLNHIQRQMIADTPMVKMFVGWPTTNAIQFADGIRVKDIEPGKFIAFSLISTDGKPIATSGKLSVGLLGTGENTDYQYDPKQSKETGFTGMMQGIVKTGQMPEILERFKATVEIGAGRTGTCSWMNALPASIETQTISGSITFDGVRTPAWVELTLNQ